MYLRPHEWKHDQRWEAQEIVPNLFCGPLRAAKDFDFIQKAGITHVIAIKYPVEERIPNPQYPNNSIHFYQINIQDGIMDNAIPFFTLFNRYVNDAINAGGRVLVYCISGLNQGAAFVISYLIKHHGMNFEDAHQLMRMRRFCTIISEAFKYQLMVTI
jgi:protein-tyrosine phosphatase